MIPVLNSRQMRAADAAAIRGGVSSSFLMENAAAAMTEELLQAFPRSRHVTVVCGPGNNGGDGLAAARLLAGGGRRVAVFTLGEPEDYRGDAAENAARAQRAGLSIRPLTGLTGFRELANALAECDVAVDALFGTGLSRGLSGRAARAVSAINGSGRPVVSADLPSGLSADSGHLIGPAVKATRTVAFAAAKLCHVLPPAQQLCGHLVVRDIGISVAILNRQRSALSISEGRDVAALLPPRGLDSHKGDFGRLAIV
ncbi:MAG TPA: NAD(P)H-hydrate epimerase, partial [Thermoanaerobaculia bacterium]|nr:NAD(P)H-hydrate epimerase [Thermoanaerobaculia bacterium]